MHNSDNTEHSQETDIHVPRRDSNPSTSMRGAAAPCLRPRCYGDMLQFVLHWY